MNNENNIKFLIIIAERKKKEDLLEMLTSSGGRIINSIYGKGSVKASFVLDAFGFVPEENKIIITSVISHDKADMVLETLTKKFNFNKPNTGIAFTIPVKGLSY